MDTGSSSAHYYDETASPLLVACIWRVHTANRLSSSMVELRDAETYDVVASLGVFPGLLMCAAFSPDNLRLAVGGCNAELMLFDVANLRNGASKLCQTRSTTVTSMCFNKSGTKLLTTCGKLTLWDVSSPEQLSVIVTFPLPEPDTEQNVYRPWFSEDESLILGFVIYPETPGKQHQFLTLWNAQTGKIVTQVEVVKGAQCFGPHLACRGPRRESYAIGTCDGKIGLVSICLDSFTQGTNLLQEAACDSGHPDGIDNIFVSSDGTKAISQSYRILNLWNLTSMPSDLITTIRFEKTIHTVAFSSDCSRVVVVLHDGFSVFDIATGSLIRSFNCDCTPCLVATMHSGMILM
jgi:WD40 repeat protein